MAQEYFHKKAYFIGTWKDNAVTDDIIKQIATLTTVEKGRKVKLKLGPDGLKITKSNFFQGKTIFDFIPLVDIFFVTINQRHPMCLLCIIKDPVQKYTIIAFRCTSELVAGTFVQNFRSLKRTAGQKDNIELRKKEDGNWTLRERTNSNARRELQQLFTTNTSKETTNSSQVPQSNGGIFYKKTDQRNTVENKPNLYEQTPYTPSNTQTIHTEVYTETSLNHGDTIHNVGTQAILLDDDQMSQFSDMSSIKGEMEALSAELKEVKYLLEKSTGISAQEHYRLAGMKRESLNNNNENQAINYNRYMEPVVVAENDYNDFTDSNQITAVAKAEVPDYRSFGIQTAPKATQRSTGPEHLIAKSVRNSTDTPSEISEYIIHSDIDKNQYKMHAGTSARGNSVEMRHNRREPEYKVARHSAGLEPEAGVIYAAQREADVGTLAYPQSHLHTNRGSVTSTIIQGKQYPRKSKSLQIKMAPSYGVIPSVVERPIEDIYSRPVIIRRDYIIGSYNRRRPHSMHVNRPLENGRYVYSSQNISKEKL